MTIGVVREPNRATDVPVDSARLAEFLRRRRFSLQPEDVGLPRGQRRRISGLRREEVASLCRMSTNYYARLERDHDARPSERMLASIAQGLRLSLDERDHLFRLAGHHPPARGPVSEHISPGVLRVFDRLADTPAEILTELGRTLRQTPLAVALNGDTTGYAGPARSIFYRWFTLSKTRQRYAPEDHLTISRIFASRLRDVVALRGPGSPAAQLADLLLARSSEFRALANTYDAGLHPRELNRLVHPTVGSLELTCQTLLDPAQSHALQVYTAIPGTESYEKLQLLSVIGA